MNERKKLILIIVAAALLFMSGFYFGTGLANHSINEKLIENDLRLCKPEAILNCREAASDYKTIMDLPEFNVVTYNTTP